MHPCAVFAALLAFLVALFVPILYPYIRLQLEREFKPRDLVIGVLSARGNFEQRQMLRETMIKHVKSTTKLSHSISIKFVIGDQACPYPIEDRLDEYACEHWHVGLQVNRDEIFAQNVQLEEKENNSHSYQYKNQVLLKVHHPIILTRLGILEELLVNPSDLTVQLWDTTQEVEIVSSKFLSGLGQGESQGGYRYRPVESYVLPKIVLLVCCVERKGVYKGKDLHENMIVFRFVRE